MKAGLPLKAKAPNRQSRQLLLFMMRMTPGQNTSPIILSIFSAFQVSVTYSNSLLHELVQQKCKSRLSQTTDSPAKRKNHDSDESGRAIVIASEEAKTIRHGSHLRQNLDKFVLITKKSVKFLSSVDHAKCDLLVSTQTKTCLRRQIFKSAVVLPRSTTFCEQQTKIVFLAVNLSVNSVNLKIFSASHFTFCCDFRIVHG